MADFLYDLITRYGVAEIVMSDQGREFVNRVNDELFKLCGTDHRISSAYHPQSNGLDERMNQTLTRALVKFVNENQDDWDVHIKSILFAYRTSKNDSTKFTPFELMFGRAPVLPIEMAIKSKPSSTDSDSLSGTAEDAPSDFDEKVRFMMHVRDQVKAQAMQNINKAQERQKKSYDAKHQPLKFSEGDSVLLRNMRNEARKGGKLERAWSGPYTINRVLPKGLYRLRNEDGTELKTSYNSSRLKVYHPPVKSQPNKSTSAEKPAKSIADKVAKTTAQKPVTSVAVNLLERDRETVLGNHRLDDNVINQAENILMKQFPNTGGWQDTVLSQTSFSAITQESIQIHHTGKNHWVCSTSIGGHLRVYDSSSCKRLTSSMEVQLAECYKNLATGSTLAVELPPAQIQQGGVDCGLFAIAFAYELAAGNDPSDVSFEQGKMREHLVKCLERGLFEPFPRNEVTLRFNKRQNCDIRLFCSCSRPECWDDMIQCELCDEWFHLTCEGLETAPEGEWLCRVCRPPDNKRVKL